MYEVVPTSMRTIIGDINEVLITVGLHQESEILHHEKEIAMQVKMCYNILRQ